MFLARNSCNGITSFLTIINSKTWTMANFFYTDGNGQRQGPVDTPGLRRLIEFGVIGPNTPLETDTGHKGVARQIPGLFVAGASPSVQPMPTHPAAPVAVNPMAFSSDSEAPFERVVRSPIAIQHNTGPGCFESKTEHERVIQYFTLQGCLARLLSGVMSDDTYDQKVMAKLNALGLKNRAIEKIGLDVDQLKEVPPVFLHGYSFDTIEVRTAAEEHLGANLANQLLANIPIIGPFLAANTEIPGFSPTYVRIGADSRLRTSKYDATWLFFSNAQIYAHKYTLDMVSDSMEETIREYFYRDIVNFSTQFSSVSPPRRSGCQAKLSGCFSTPKIRENNVFLLVVSNDVFECSISGVPDAERSIQAMKQLIREKKG